MPKLVFWKAKKTSQDTTQEPVTDTDSNSLMLPTIRTTERLSVGGIWNAAAKRHLDPPVSPLPPLRVKDGSSFARDQQMSYYSVFAHAPTPKPYLEESKQLQKEVRLLLSQGGKQRAQKIQKKPPVEAIKYHGPFADAATVRPSLDFLNKPARFPTRQGQGSLNRRPSLTKAPHNFSRPFPVRNVSAQEDSPTDPDVLKFRRRSNSVPSMPTRRVPSTMPSPAWSRIGAPSMRSPSMESLTSDSLSPVSSIDSFDTSSVYRAQRPPPSPVSPTVAVQTAHVLKRTPSRLVRTPTPSKRAGRVTFES